MLIRKLTIAFFTLGLVALSDVAIATQGVYVFGSYGSTGTDVSLDTATRVDDSRGSFRIGAGYAVNRNFSLEAAFHKFAGQSATTDCPPDFACAGLVVPLVTRADSTAYSLSFIGSVPVTDRFGVFGKVGLASWDVDFRGISSAFDASGEDLLYGAGLRWSLDDQWSIFAEYEKLELEVDTAGIGLSYRF